MNKVRIEDLDPYMGPAAVKHSVGRALGTSELAINYYELDPGDSFGFGYHAHEHQEEVFYVQSGTVTFETDDGDVTVREGECIQFEAGEHQRGINTGNDRVVGLAIGAPRDSGELYMYRECETCGDRTRNRIEMAENRDAILTYCTECDEVTGRFVYGELTDESH